MVSSRNYFGLIIILISALSLAPITQGEDISKMYTAETVDLDLRISSSVDIYKKEYDSYVESFKAVLSYYPKNDILQHINYFDTDPSSRREGDNITFTWDEPTADKLYFSIDADITTKNRKVQFSEPVEFPIKVIPETVSEYIMPSDKIDSDNPDIMRKASGIVGGETDLFSAVYNLAWWTKNEVSYNLSTLTADANQKASWVLENRYGVCDEITNLFIAMCRAVGIPARFISGISYTESELFSENWGPHGWAEVYFPGYGWIPFDITFGEFGYVDASHIKLKSSLDSDESSVNYEWRSKNVEVKTNPLDFEVTVSSTEGFVDDPFTFDVKVLKDEVGFGSYNLIEVELENPSPYYISAQLFISDTQGLTLEGENSNQVLLKPFSSDKIFWKVRVDDGLDRDYVYTFPVQVYTSSDFSRKLEFTSESSDPVYSEDEIERYIAKNKVDEEKVVTFSFDYGCVPTQEYFYIYETPKVYCEADNTGNVMVEGLSLCIDLICERFSLPISGSTDFVIELPIDDPGKFEKTIYLTSGDNQYTDEINITVLDEPRIIVENLSYPKNLGFGETGKISFTLSKDSFSDPLNVSVVLSKGSINKKWTFDEISRDRGFSVIIDSQELSMKNAFTLSVGFEDRKGRRYLIDKGFDVELSGLGFTDKVQVRFKDTLRLIDENLLLSTIIIATIVFLIVMLIINTGRNRRDDKMFRSYKRKISSESEKDFYRDMRKEEMEDEKLFKD